MTEYKAIQKNISTDYESGKRLITYEIQSGDSPESLEACKNKVLRLTVKQWKDKRSLDANSYYWQLISKLSAKLKISAARCHNQQLRDCGIPEIISDQVVYMQLPDTDKAEEMALEAETYHLKPTYKVDWNANGRIRYYMLLKGSHEMDTAEFSRLINNLVDDCKEQGIETLPPDEIAHLVSLMGEKR